MLPGQNNKANEIPTLNSIECENQALGNVEDAHDEIIKNIKAKINYSATYQNDTGVAERHGRKRETQEDRVVAGTIATDNADPDWETTLHQTVATLSAEVKDKIKVKAENQGSCLLASVVVGNKVYTANVGDSQGYIVKIDANDNVTVDILIEKLHKPDNPEERIYIENTVKNNMRGFVKEATAGSPARLLGGLAISRAIGDTIYEPYLRHEADTDMMSVKLDGIKKAFVIIGCDGLSDNLSIEDIEEIVKENQNLSTSQLASVLAKKAEEGKVPDNISVLVTPLSSDNQTPRFAAVFDGHGGSAVSEFLYQNFTATLNLTLEQQLQQQHQTQPSSNANFKDAEPKGPLPTPSTTATLKQTFLHTSPAPELNAFEAVCEFFDPNRNKKFADRPDNFKKNFRNSTAIDLMKSFLKEDSVNRIQKKPTTDFLTATEKANILKIAEKSSKKIDSASTAKAYAEIETIINEALSRPENKSLFEAVNKAMEQALNSNANSLLQMVVTPNDPLKDPLNNIVDNKNYYQILGISETATFEEARNAYRRLVLEYHPDKAKNEADRVYNAEKFKAIDEAYKTLGDNEKRKLYNSNLPVLLDSTVAACLKDTQALITKIGHELPSNKGIGFFKKRDWQAKWRELGNAEPSSYKEYNAMYNPESKEDSLTFLYTSIINLKNYLSNHNNSPCKISEATLYVEVIISAAEELSIISLDKGRKSKVSDAITKFIDTDFKDLKSKLASNSPSHTPS